MKSYKMYGEQVYINNEKVNAYELENAVVQNNVANFGYGQSNMVFVFENEFEKDLLDTEGLKDFNEITMPYATFKTLQKSAGAAYLKSKNYNAETKTITVSCQR